MGLFNLFNKKEKLPEMNDLVWKNQTAKYNGLLALIEQYQDAVWICWFSETQTSSNFFIKSRNVKQIDIRLARTVQPSMVENRPVVFLEHYPLRLEEEKLIENWNPKQIFVLNSLDEPLFEAFGGERIVHLMESLGMQEDEQIQHAMISKSIKRAQEKLQEKVNFENTATSQKDWFRMNIG